MAKKAGAGFLFNQKVAPYVFVCPFILSLLIFWAYPLISAFVMSFQNIEPGVRTFIGWRNYQVLLRDKTFFTAVGNSFLYMILTLVLLIPFPLLWATLMDSNYVKAKGFFKAFLYAPALTSVVVSSIIFRLAFSEMPASAANEIATWVTGHAVAYKWLNYKTTAYFALLLICCWRWTGVNMLYFMSGLNSIDAQLYEAAEIDGCNKFQKWWHVTIPLLKPTTIYVLTISIFAGLSMFMEVYMLMGNGGPRNICLTIVGYLYRRGIEQNRMGYASTVGIALLIIALVINIAQLAATGTLKQKKE
jgi:arabinosaccharide transport system permease protein